MKTRCAWCGDNPLYVAYHDHEWGVPVRDDRLLFEFLILEGAQAGLSWLTILKKRQNYRRAFADFDVNKVARFGPKDTSRLLADAGIVRNRLKIAAAISNAQAVHTRVMISRCGTQEARLAASGWASVVVMVSVMCKKGVGRLFKR